MEQLKQDLYDALYWHFREEYASVVDFIEKENKIKINYTKNAELYVQEQIEKVIKKMEAKNE